MNVKPGQLAMFRPGYENAGRVVRVVEEDREPLLQMVKQTLWWSCEALQHIRRFKGFGNTEQPPFPPGSMVPVPDSALMPLHDGDGEDEILRIAGKPVQRDETLTPRRQVEHAR